MSKRDYNYHLLFYISSSTIKILVKSTASFTANLVTEIGTLPDTRLKVLHVVRQFPPSSGGLETYVNELSQRQSYYHDVDVLTLNRIFENPERLPPVEQRGNVNISRIPFLGYRRLFLPILRPNFLRRYDVIHVHAADQLLDFVALMTLRMNAKLFMTTHGLFFHTEKLAKIKRFYLKTITRWSLSHQNAVFAVSGNDAETLRKVGIKSVLLRNPIVPLGTFICEGQDLLYVGRISANKRIPALIEFMSFLVKDHPAVTLHLVGSDSENLWGKLSDLVKSKGLGGNIRYHGFLDNDALASLARTCGFTVSASRYEGFGLSVVEGMSVGLVPFTHENAAFKETYTLSGAGFLTNFDDPAQAARDFTAWSHSVSRADRVAAARFAHGQTWDAVCDVYERYYGHYQVRDSAPDIPHYGDAEGLAPPPHSCVKQREKLPSS